MSPENGKIYGVKNVLAEEQKFFEQIYKSKISRVNTDQTKFNQFFNRKPKEIPEYLAPLETPITEREIHKALLEMDNNKSPVDFYKAMWPKVKDHLVAAFRESLREGTLTITQRQGIISLIPKKILLHNWRPLSILNHDQKY